MPSQLDAANIYTVQFRGCLKVIWIIFRKIGAYRYYEYYIHTYVHTYVRTYVGVCAHVRENKHMFVQVLRTGKLYSRQLGFPRFTT